MNNTVPAQKCDKFAIITLVHCLRRDEPPSNGGRNRRWILRGDRDVTGRIRELEDTNRKLELRKEKFVRVWVELTYERGASTVELQSHQVATVEVDEKGEPLKFELSKWELN
jgi:hypothetical protein